MEKKNEIYGKLPIYMYWNNGNWLYAIITRRSTFGGQICHEFAMFEFSIECFDTQAVCRGKVQCYPLLRTNFEVYI